VDLSNICISITECHDHWLAEVAGHLEVLTQAIGDGKGDLHYEKEPCLAALRGLREVCIGGEPEKASNAKKLLASKQAANDMARFCAVDDEEVAIVAFRALEVRRCDTFSCVSHPPAMPCF
jgi:hypothetical protein